MPSMLVFTCVCVSEAVFVFLFPLASSGALYVTLLPSCIRMWRQNLQFNRPCFLHWKFDLDLRKFSNGRISETEKATGDPLVTKFSYRLGLSPTLSWKWPRATLSPSFGLFFERNHSFGVFPVSQNFTKWVRICPREPFPWWRKKFYRPLKFVSSFMLALSVIFTQPIWKHMYLVF